MSRPLEVVCMLALGDAQVRHHLAPIARSDRVSRIWLVRHAHVAGEPIPKTTWVPVSRAKPQRFLQMYRIGRALAERDEVGAFVSFNPIPYGLLGLYAARRRRVPTHLGFIGSDWYRDAVRAPWLVPILRRATLITATGTDMRTAMIDRGLAPEKVKILPHTIDLEAFSPGKPQRAEYDAVFVGSLIDVKGVDVIVDAWGQLLQHRPCAKLCVVGDGPRLADLRRQAERVGADGQIEFAGHQRDVGRYLRRARAFVMGSRSEGLPFALIEAMATGLVPVVTPVGTIPDLVDDGVNGYLVPVGDAGRMAQTLAKVLSDDALHGQLRARVLEHRDDFGHHAATRLWERDLF